MLCLDCGEKEAFAKGLCKTCYARDRRKNGKKPCSVEGCGLPAVSKGLCSKHSQRAKQQANARTIPDLPGEEWRDINGHPGWRISTRGRVKSLRNPNERLITPRVVNGSLFIADHSNGSFAVHLQVLKTFRKGVIGEPIFVDGNKLNPSLDNLKWDTRSEKIQRAIIMAEGSDSRWGEDFAAYWRGDKNALNMFFEEMRKYLLKAVRKKIDIFWGLSYLNEEELVHATLVRFFFSVYEATIKSLDGILGYLLTIADNVLRRHWRYSKPLIHIEESPEDSFEGSANMDRVGYFHPSAELVAMYNECLVSE